MRTLVVVIALIMLTAKAGFTPLTTISIMAQQEQPVSLRFSTSSLTTSPGQDFKLSVIVEDAIELAGFDIQLSWNTGSLAYVTHTLTVPVEDYPDPVSPSPYAGILNDPVFVIMDQVNETTGTYWCAASRLVAAFNGSGTIATIVFRALDQPGSTYVEFTNHELADQEGMPISHTAANLSVNIWRLHISIVSPENRTYSLSDVPLTFNLSMPASWIGYSLDGQENVTIDGNFTLDGLSDGTHVIAVYANDTIGNEGRSMDVYFMIDTTPPIITIASPENKTYETNSVPVNLTISELTSWIGYSLDGHANTTISGSFALSGLSNGLHSLVVYANDTAGNTGSSLILQFTIEKAGLELFPVTVAAVAVITVVGVFAGWLYLAKVRKGKDAKASTGKKTDLAAAIVE